MSPVPQTHPELTELLEKQPPTILMLDSWSLRLFKSPEQLEFAPQAWARRW